MVIILSLRATVEARQSIAQGSKKRNSQNARNPFKHWGCEKMWIMWKVWIILFIILLTIVNECIFQEKDNKKYPH